MAKINKIMTSGTLTTAFMLSGAEKPLARVGILTDSHINKSAESCVNVKKVFEVFKKHNVDIVAHVGDLSDRFWPEAYQNYNQTWNEVFSDKSKQPAKLFSYARHDDIDDARVRGGHFPELQKLLNGNDPYCDLKLNGYHFIAVPEYDSIKLPNGKFREDVNIRKYRAMLKKAAADTPDKPIFVFDHAPAEGTVHNSGIGGLGCMKRRELLKEFPNVIHINGHTHGSPSNNRQLWQGEFTSFNGGSLIYWTGTDMFTGFSTDIITTCNALLMEVYADKVVVRRFFFPSKKEYASDRPWIIPLPFDAKTAPYNIKNLAKSSPKPVFPEGAAVKLKTDKPFKTLSVKFPAAEHPDKTYIYRIELSRKVGGKWEKFGSSTFFGTSKVKQQKKLEMKLKKTGIAPIFESSQTKIGGYDAGQSLLYPKDSWISTAKCKIYVKQCIFFIETD